VNFLATAEEIKDTTPQEVRRLLLQQLVPFKHKYVIEAERNLESNNPTVLAQLCEGLTEDQVKRAINELIGEIPSLATHVGRGVFKIKFQTLGACKKMMALHMSEMEGLEKPLMVSKVEAQLGAPEIFDLIHEKLCDKEKLDTFQLTNPERRVRRARSESPVRSREKNTTPAPVREGG